MIELLLERHAFAEVFPVRLNLEPLVSARAHVSRAADPVRCVPAGSASVAAVAGRYGAVAADGAPRADTALPAAVGSRWLDRRAGGAQNGQGG